MTASAPRLATIADLGAIDRLTHELVRGGLRVGQPGQDCLDLLTGQLVGQAVGADQEDVTGLGGELPRVDRPHRGPAE